MRKLTWIPLILCIGICACGAGDDQQYPYRWVYASSRLADDADVERVKGVVQTAADHGLNGILLSCGADRLDMQSDEYVGRLLDLQAFSQERGVEIIPSIFSTGYGGSLLAHNRNLAAGLPVEDALFVVKGDQAEFVADSPFLAGLIIAMVLLVIFSPSLRFSQKLINKYLVGENTNTSQIFQTYSQSISNILDINQLATVALGLIKDALDVKSGFLGSVDLAFGEDGKRHYHLKGYPVAQGEKTTNVRIPLGSQIALQLGETRSQN